VNSRDRVLSSLERRGYDRIPVKHEGTPEVNRELMSHFGVENYDELLKRLGDDFRYVQAELYCFRRKWTNASKDIVYKKMEVGRMKGERKQYKTNCSRRTHTSSEPRTLRRPPS